MQASLVFTSCIRYLKQHLMKHFASILVNIQETDIRWVLTVPAIWSDAAKQFMRRSAE